MPHKFDVADRLDATDDGFEEAFQALLNAKREMDEDVDRVVADILSDVRHRGDAALVDYTNRFDRVAISASDLRIPQAELEGAAAKCEPETIAALKLAADRIRSFHEKTLPGGLDYTDAAGVRLGARWTPVSAAGLYVPGGTAAYPSSVLMNAMPAKVAGVPRLVMVVPTPDDVINPLVMAAAHLAGVDEVYRVGGAQAVGALAYGTETILPVDKIVGPGNRFVMEAKRQLFGLVGIESLPGPTETLVLADSSARPQDVIADLLAQAEHEGAVPVLVTDSQALLDAVLAGLPEAAAGLPTAETANESLEKRGAAILVADLQEGMQVANEFAPEHLCLLVEDPDALLPLVTNAGGIFVGHSTMEALGDYIAGPSHVMPTGRSARFSSFVNLRDFQKVMPVVRSSRQLVAETGPAGARMARAEGLEAHARAIESRLN